ncbi:MAG: hypothetical protein ACTTJ4_05375 [Treponema sp.]|uniref:hypothetical protein n=1 Tax=Treponema sp. TaxID=166 RepID=UPI003FA31272
MIRIAHIADLHCCREHQEAAMKSLRYFAEYMKVSPCDLAVIAGDTWDASMLNTEASGFNGFIDAFQDIANTAPVAMIYGTPSHDTDGSLEVFRKITAKHSITVLDAAQAYMLLDSGTIAVASGSVPATAKAVLFGIPEPRKKYLLANSTAGKDETEAALRTSMQKLCFLLAAKRREYAALPCVMLYHGEVAGCTLQNDRTIERGTGISITINDLADIGADYYALGHIHKPQQIGTLPAYYVGSIYPKDFGETHQAGFNVVEIDGAGSPARVERVNFPHPQNIKIEAGTNCNLETYDVAGKRVWLDITCTKEEQVFIDSEALRAALLQRGAVESSRVTVSALPVETVRAAEITEAASVSEKYKVWADNSGIEVKDSIIRKVAVLDVEIKADSAKAHGAWELVSLKLRGATGIKKGIGKDEITIDFDSYDSGLIALTGENGKGKTTLIENCHPYPQLLTRKGKLQDHFCLQDSFREVIYRDRETERMVKCLIQIDGATKSGSCNYFAFTSHDKGASWEAVPSVDKNSKPYEDFVAATFGAMELFLRTAFITQRSTKNLPDLTDATAGEKKTLFAELAGIDYLQKFSDAANERAKLNSQAAHDAEIKVQLLESAIARKQELESAFTDAQKQLTEKQSELVTVTDGGKAARVELNTAQERAHAERERSRRYAEAQQSIGTVRQEISALEQERSRNEAAAASREANEACIKEYEQFQDIINAEQKKRNAVNEANSARMGVYLADKAAFDQKVMALEKQRDSLADQRSIIEREILTAQNTVKLHERDAAEINDVCPTCGQKLPADKIAELENKRSAALETMKESESSLAECEKRLTAVDADIEALTREIAALAFEEPAKPTQQHFDSHIENSASAKLHTIDIARARSELETAKTAAIRIEGINAQLTDKGALMSALEKEAAALAAHGDTEALSALSAAQTKLDLLTEQYTAIKSAIAAIEATIESTQKNLAEVAAQESALVSARAESTTAKIEATEWELLAKAFGRDGIQALELDALAPGISETANRLLESAYGDRFCISIETTRIGGQGKARKQIEDFKIMVTDSTDGEATALENKSGGEAVWIKRAIYDAFAVIRRRNTGFAFLTCFQDETDGALDAAAKTAYCRMLEASHEAAQLRHTVIITHSNEVKAMIEQKIAMESL